MSVSNSGNYWIVDLRAMDHMAYSYKLLSIFLSFFGEMKNQIGKFDTILCSDKPKEYYYPNFSSFGNDGNICIEGYEWQDDLSGEMHRK